MGDFKLYTIQESTSYLFGSEGGGEVAWTTESVANNAGRQSAFLDLGVLTTARATRFRYRFYTQFQATPTIDIVGLNLYLKTSDGTHPDNDDGTGDVAVSALSKLNNVDYLDSINVDQAAANIEMVTHGEFDCFTRYLAFVLWNVSGAAITADAAETKLQLWAIPPYMKAE